MIKKALQGSKTEENLRQAYAGESQARNKYVFYASAAKKEGFEQIAAILLETADNEQEHAKMCYKYLQGLADTATNLGDCIEGEKTEQSSMYPGFARTAREEGFDEIADFFERVGRIEADHERRFRELLQNVQSNTVFKKGEPLRWRCRNCGNIHEGPEAPDECAVCHHPRAFFEIVCERF